MAADESLNEEDIIRGMVEKLGAVLECGRLVYSSVTPDRLTSLYEWKSRETKGTAIGLSVDRKVFDNVSLDSQEVLTKDILSKMVPPMVWKILGPFVNLLISRIGDHPALSTPCIVGEKTEGVITCTGGLEPVTAWSEEKKSLVLEAGRIVTKTIENKRAGRMARESGMQYKSLFEGMSEAVFVVELAETRKILQVNDTACARLGYSKNELLGRAIDSFSVAGKQIFMPDVLEEFKKTGKTLFEADLAVKSGKVLPVEINGNIIEYEGKKAIIAIAKDLTEARKTRAKAELRTFYSDLSAEIWRIAADRDLDEKYMIDSLLKKIGSDLNISRVSYSTVDKESIYTLNQWTAKGVVSNMGHKSPAFLAGFMKKDILYEFDGGSNFTYIPAPARGLVKKIINEVMLKNNLRAVMTLPVFIEGKAQGTISFDIEAVNTAYAGMDDDKRKIIIDLANIVAQGIEKRRAEKKMEESEKLYREVFNNANDAIIMQELIMLPGSLPSFKLLDYNDMTCVIFELKREIMKDLKLAELMDKQTLERMTNHAAASENGTTIGEVVKMKTGKGRDITADIRVRIFDFGGKRILLSVARDITEKDRSETALKESEEKYRELFNNANDGIFINELDSQGRVGGFFEVNDTACKITGYERRDFVRMTPRDLATKESLGTFLDVGRALAQTGRATYEQTLLKKDGGVIVVENNTHKFILKGRPIVLTVMRDITERIKISNALKESEELYRTLINTSPDAVTMSDLKGKLLFASQRMAKLHGYGSADEVIGRSIFDFVDLQSKKDIMKEFSGFLSKGSQAYMQYKALRKNGSTFTGEINASIIKGPNLLPKGVIATIRDVSDRIMAVEALRSSEEKYRNVISRTGQLVYEYDVNNGVITWGGAVQEITGYTEEEYNREVSIDIWEQIIHPDDRAYVLEEHNRAREACGKYHSEYRYRHRNGGYIYIEDDATFLPDGDGKPCKMLGVMKDITHRKEAETALKESEEKFRSLSEQSMLGIAIIQDGVFKYFNNAFASMNGFSVQEMTSWKETDLLKVIHPDDVQAVRDRLYKRQTGEEGSLSHNYQFRLFAKDGGTKWLDVYAATVMYNGRPADFITQADITALKETESKLKFTIEELTRSNAELEQFAYVASHDLQEPLRMVSSYVQLLKKRYEGKLGQDADDFIGFAVDGADRMQKLIKDLLAYSRVGTHKKEHTNADLDHIIETAMLNLDPVIKETGATIKYQGLPVVFADEAQMVQLVQNLISNSIKFCRAEEKPEIEIKASVKGPEVTVSLKDNGIGINSQYFEKIFVIFQRLHGKSDYPGTGIGLSICKKIVESHGGKIWLESAEGKGSTFYFTVPSVKN